MIKTRNIKAYCCEDISLIENYDEAVNSEDTWHCHHKLEIELNKTRKELNELGLYFNRPASELIFMTAHEHLSLHNKGRVSPTKGKEGPMKGKHHTEETKKKLSEKNKGKESPMKGKKTSDEVKKKQSEAHKKFASSLTAEERKNIYGHNWTTKEREAVSKRQVGTHLSDETKRKISEAHKGKHTNNAGKHWTINKETGKREWHE